MAKKIRRSSTEIDTQNISEKTAIEQTDLKIEVAF